ncbi:MAG: caspase family protein [SAR324 cluster bacterium]|nr:caspase family protein [SAR324 cluster bacterium]
MKIWRLLITPDGRLVTASDDKTIRIWNPKNGREERKILGQLGSGSEGKIYSIALSPDGKLLASGGYFMPEHVIRLHDFHSGELRQILKGHENVVYDLDFSPDGRWLVSGSGDYTVRIWKRSGSRFTAGPVLQGHENDVYAVRLFEDKGRLRVVSASDDHTVRLWDAESGRQLALGRHDEDPNWIAVGPDWIASAGYDKTIRIWDYALRPIRTIRSETKPTGLAAHPDGNRLLSGTSSYPYKVNIWNVHSGKLLTSYTGHENLTMAVGWLPDGTAVSAGGDDKEIVFWDADTGREKRRIVGGGRAVWASGLKGSQFGFGTTWTANYGKSDLEHAFDFASLQVTKLSKSDASSFQRLRTHFGPLRLSHEKGGDYGYSDAVLVIKEGSRERARVVRDATGGYVHRVYGFTPDGSIVSGGANGQLSVYNKDGKELANLVGHEGTIWVLAVEGNRLLSGSADQTLKLWDLGQVGSKQTIEPTVSLFVSFDKTLSPPEPSGWVAWTKSGYYASSLNGDRLIGFHVNRGSEKSARFYDSSRFYESLYNPELVRQAFLLGSEQQAIAKLKKTRRTEQVEVSAILPPEVRIVSPANGVEISGSEATLELEVTLPGGSDRNTELKLIVKLNGRSIEAGQRGVKRTEADPSSGIVRRFSRTVPLDQGENVIEVLAKSPSAISNPAVITLSSRQAAPADPFMPNLYVLSIGVSDYENNDLDLRFAHADAEGIARAFKSQQGRLFGEVRSRVLTNEEATKGEILDGFDWLESEVTQRDVAVVFVAGHGVNDSRDNYWFLPHDANPEKLRRSAVQWSDFNSILADLPGKTLLMVDTCKSGNVTGSKKFRGISRSDSTSALKELLRTESGVVVMTASTGSELSVEDTSWGHGAFTKALLDGLKGSADYDSDQVITLKELDLYVTRTVKTLTNGQQRPTTTVPPNFPDFPLFMK